MRKLLLLLTLAACTFIAINRMRLYIRNPIATVSRGGAKVQDAAVFINYANDVLLQVGRGSNIHQYLVQNWNHVPGSPEAMRCVRDLACLAEADRAPALPLPAAASATMTSRQVTFFDEAHQPVTIVLR